MGGTSLRALGPVGFTLFWLGIATVVVFGAGLVVGVARDDVAGTSGTVVWVGLSIAAVLIVLAVLRRETQGGDDPPEA